MPPIKDTEKEARVILALKALENDKRLSLRAAAKLYNVPPMTLSDRRAGRTTQSDATPRSKKLTQLAQPGNREWATVIPGICAQGWAIPPFIILAAQYHLGNWYQECDLPADWRIATTDNGWTNNAVGLDWIKHFDHHTASLQLQC